MPDTLTINELELWTRIGVTEAERSTPQRILVSIEMELDTTKAAAADDHSLSIDYETVCKAVKELKDKERNTIEHLASEICELVLKEFKPLRVSATVQKFVIPGTKSVSLRVSKP